MATKFDNSLFDDTPHPQAKSSSKFDESLFEDKPSDNVGIPESVARGALQGVTFGTADELSGATEALGNAAFGDEKLQDLLSNYRKYRDESRSHFDAAEKANPKSFMAGDIGAGLATGLLTGGAGAVANLGKVGLEQSVKQLAILGAKQGAASALGHSDADLTTGDLDQYKQAAKDTAIGAGVGGVAGATLPVVAQKIGAGATKVGEYVQDKAPNFAKKGVQAYNLAKKGIEVVGDKAAKVLDSDASNAANDILASFKNQYKKGSSDVGTALKSVTQDQDFSPQLNKIEEALKNSKMLPDDLAKIQSELDLYKQSITTEKVQPGIYSAMDKMQDILDKAKAEAQALGENVTFSNPKNVEGTNLIQTVKTKNMGDEIIDTNKIAQEGTGLAKAQDSMKQKIAKMQAEANQLGEKVTVSDPIFDQESNALISTVTSMNKNGEPVARTITQSVPKDATLTVPTFADKMVSSVHQVEIPDDKIMQETVDSFRNMNLQELNNVKKELNALLNGNKLNSQSKSILSGVEKELDNAITTSMDSANKALYTEGNKGISNVYNAGELLPPIAPSNVFSKDMDINLKNKLLSGSKMNQEKVERALGYGSGLDDIFKANVKELPVRQELLKDVKGEGGILGGLVNMKGASIRTGEALGKASNAVTPAKDFTRKIINMNDNALNGIATKLQNSSNEGIKSLGTTLNRALSDSTKRDRLLWSLSQQPAFREAISDAEREDNTLVLPTLDVN